MVVDDREDQLFTTKLVLEYLDKEYKILTANSGIKCLELLENEIPDLILLDILMPDMNGLDVFKRIKNKSELSNIPILFMTAIGDDASLLKAEKISNGLILKPFSSNKLREKINNILNKK